MAKKKTKTEIVEYKPRAQLVESKRGGSTWHTYQYRKEDMPVLIEDIERQYKIIPQKNHLNVVEDKEGFIKPYLTKSGLNAIANANEIRTTVEVSFRKLTKPYYAEVTAVAILPHSGSHEAVGACEGTEPGRKFQTFAQILGMAQTRARNKAIETAMEIQPCSWEEMDSPEMQKRVMKIDALNKEVLRLCPFGCEEIGYSPSQKMCVKCGQTQESVLQAKNKSVK